MNRKGRRKRGYLMAGAGMLLLGGMGAVAITHPAPQLDGRNCVIGRSPPQTLAIAIDASDRLVSSQPREITYAVEEKLTALKKGDRVLVLDAAGEPTAEAEPIVDQCDAGDDDNLARNAFRRAIVRPIVDHLHDLEDQPPSDQSPIAGEHPVIGRRPRSLHIPGSQLTILFATDGLQSSALQSRPYRKGSNFPKPEGTPLRAITVDLVLIEERRDLALPAAGNRPPAGNGSPPPGPRSSCRSCVG